MNSDDLSLLPQRLPIAGEQRDRAASEPFEGNAKAVNTLPQVEDLYAAEHTRLFRFFLFALRDADAASTLTQDTFVKAWRTRASFRGDCAPATGLMRIAVNLLRDHTRRGAYRFWQRVTRTSVDAASLAEALPVRASSAEQDLIAREQVAHLWRTVETLSGRQRTVFLLRHVEQLDLPSIADVTGMPLATVKTHLYRALDRLRRAMEEDKR